MDANECNGMYGHGGVKKRDKKSPKWARRTCFVMYASGQNNLKNQKGWPKGSEKMQGVNYGRPTGSRCDIMFICK